MSDDPTQASSNDLPGDLPEILGPCRLMRRLGAGSMGDVYLAKLIRDCSYGGFGQNVAVKVLHPGQLEDASAFKRFLREGQIGRRLQSPAVVRTYDVDAVSRGGRTYHYLVLEYVEGETLRALIARLGVVPEGLLRQLAIQIVDGLAAIHANGAVHRDLKPANIMITTDHQVRVMDLGLAHQLEASVALTRANQFVGTLLYAAPEQFGGGPVTPAADLYALGAILYEAATGTRPFRADSAAAIIRRHLEHTPPKVGTLNSQLSPFLEELVACLLEKDPARRFASASDLHAVLEKGEESPWWKEREIALRAAHPRRAIRRIKVRRDFGFTGRDEELAAIAAAYADARGGHGRLVLIEGEAGVGKTRLLDEFLARLEQQDENVLLLCTANAPGSSGGGPGALARAVVAHFGDAHVDDGLRQALSAIPRLVPAFAALLLGGPPPAGSEPLSADAVHTCFCHLARSLAAEAPVVWIAEDLHFAPAEGHALLLALARVAQDLPLLLLATTRPGLAPEYLAHLERLPIVRRLRVNRFSPREVVLLLRDALGSEALADRLAGRVAFRSDGNPFFVAEFVRALREAGSIEQQADGSFVARAEISDVGVPSSVRELLLSRLTDIGEEDRPILDVAAVQGFRFDPDLVARVLERKRLAVLQVLAAAERRSGIVRATGAGFEFDHHQLQEVLYGSLPPLLRSEYHALLAGAYTDKLGLRDCAPEAIRGEAAVFLSEHLLRGERRGEGLAMVSNAIAYLESGFRHEALVDCAALAISALPSHPADAREAGLRAEIRLREAACLDLLGRRPEQRAALEDAVHSADLGREENLAARARLALGWLHYSTSAYDQARGVFEDAVERARLAGDTETEGRALCHLGSVLTELASWDEARDHFERSLDLARACGDRQGEANAIGNLGILHLARGEHAQAKASLERQHGLCLEIRDRRGESRALGNLAIVLRYLGDYAGAIEHHERGLRLSSELGYRRGEALAAGNLGGVHYYLGDLGRARAGFERHLALSREVGGRAGEAVAEVNLGQLALTEGRLVQADVHIEACLGIGRALGAKALEADALLARADVARARGVSARALYEEAMRFNLELGTPEGVASAALALGRCLLDDGDREAARPLIVEAGALAPAAELLSTAYQALLGAREPTQVVVAERAPAVIRAEAHIILWRAGGGDAHHARALSLLAMLAAHLTGPDLEQFWRQSPLARAFAAGSATQGLTPASERT